MSRQYETVSFLGRQHTCKVCLPTWQSHTVYMQHSMAPLQLQSKHTNSNYILSIAGHADQNINSTVFSSSILIVWQRQRLCREAGAYSSSLDTLQLTGVQGVLCQAAPLLQQGLSSWCQCSPHLAHLRHHEMIGQMSCTDEPWC